MTPAELITKLGDLVAAVNTDAESIGINACELRLDGGGVDIVTPGIIAMLTPPTSPLAGAQGIPSQPWELTWYILPKATGSAAADLQSAMEIAQRLHDLVSAAWRSCELAAEPFSIIRAQPTTTICTLNYDVLFSLFP